MSKQEKMEFELLNKRSLHDGYFQLNEYTYRNQLFAGGWSQPFTREVFERGHAAAALLFDPVALQLVLVEQFRPGAVETEDSPWLTELVAGIIEVGEKPCEVIRRESIEEANCTVGRLRKIHEYLVSPGGTTERIWLYLAEVDSSSLDEYGGLEHEHEDIKIHKIPVQQAFDMLDSGKMNNAMTIIALQWLKLHWNERDNLWRE